VSHKYLMVDLKKILFLTLNHYHALINCGEAKQNDDGACLGIANLPHWRSKGALSWARCKSPTVQFWSGSKNKTTRSQPHGAPNLQNPWCQNQIEAESRAFPAGGSLPQFTGKRSFPRDLRPGNPLKNPIFSSSSTRINF
jgi:hypothetical protein